MNELKITDHINLDHRAYACYDNERSIPHISDGLKPSQRKLFFAIQTVPKGKEIKVTNLASKASDLTHYKHGEDSLQDALVKMAQDFVGSNNLPWFIKEGSFGTKMDREASETRYIFVKRSADMESHFHQADECLLTKQYEDGDEIEPRHYLPSFPLLLLNGCDGVGNGYSSYILPREYSVLLKAVRELIAGKPCPDLPIGYKGFKGRVEKNGKAYRIVGKYEKVDRTTLKIVDLPPDQSFQWDEYSKRVLLPLLESKEINSYDNDSTETEWNIVIKAPMAFFKCTDKELEAKLGLTLNVTETVVAWDWKGKLTKFENAEAMLSEWVSGRLPFYESRKISTLERLAAELGWLACKIWFLDYWNRHSQELCILKKDALKQRLLKDSSWSEEFIDRCLQLRISNLSLDEIEYLKDEYDAKAAEKSRLETKTGKDLMLEDLK